MKSGLTAPILAIALLILSNASFAAEADSEWTACINDPSHPTNGDWNACGIQLIAREDAKMTIAWEAALAHFGGAQTESGQELLAEQRLWIAYKDRVADVYCLPGGGREPCVLDRNLAKAKIIAERTEQLKSYLPIIY